MRISTSMIYQAGGDAISRQTADLLATQQRLSLGKRMLTPADDPAAATQALAVTAAKGVGAQYDANIGVARDALSTSEGVLAQVTDALQSVRTLAVNSGAGSLSDADRSTIADQLAGQLADLIGLANSKDGNGSYLFSGYAQDTRPFVQAAAGTVTYSGDQGQRQLDVGSGRSMAISLQGEAIFMTGRSGNGTFATTSAAANQGTGVIDAGSVTDTSALTGDRYAINFTSATQYEVWDTTTSLQIGGTNTYTAGSAVGLPGMQATITGAPVAGDAFATAPSSAQSVFSTIQSLVDTLRTPGGTPAGRTRIANGVGQALTNLDQGMGNVMTARAGLGAGLTELDSLSDGNASRDTQYDQTLSRLDDLDYARALSDFSQQQVALDAAQKSFLKVSGLSLFSAM